MKSALRHKIYLRSVVTDSVKKAANTKICIQSADFFVPEFAYIVFFV